MRLAVPHSFGANYKQIIVALAALLLTSISVGAIPYALNRWWLILLFIPTLLLGFHYYEKVGKNGQALLVGSMLGLVTAGGYRAIATIYSNVMQPPEWDFLFFWVYGHAAVQGLNFYEPEVLRQLAQPLNPSDMFVQELYFFYPPPTMFLFAPLGWFNISPAYLIWYIIQSVILGLNIVLLWQIFLKSRGILGLLLTATLIFTLHSTLSTLDFGQTNFIMLLFLLLFWRDRERRTSGVWLALGILIKPILLFLFLYLLINRRWQIIMSSIITLVVISLITILIFGPTVFFSYFISNPIVNHMPASLYTETINQSLLATIHRTLPTFMSPAFIQPIFVVLAVVLTGITCVLIYHSDRMQLDWALALLLTLALLLYPKTLAHYSVLLIVPIMLFWQRRREFVGGVWMVTFIIGLEYMFINYRSGEFVFVANLFAWGILAGVGIWAIVKRVQPVRPILNLPS